MSNFGRAHKVILSTAIALFVLGAGAGAAWSQAKEDELLGAARGAIGRLPASVPSADNPITPAKVALGKVLFWETRVSVDGKVSCARCHQPSLYGTDGLAKSVGNNDKLNSRNAPTVLNAAGQMAEHWIGNRDSVEDQAKQALIGPASFGMPSYDAAVAALKAIPGYAPLFAAAFPGEPNPISADNFALAVGAFERTLVTPGPFDAFVEGDADALSPQQKRGLATFFEQECVACHSGPFLGGQDFEKFGVVEPYAKYTGSKELDDGRFTATQDEADRYVFKVPVLRNVAKTAPYFHDGSVSSLDEAVRIMAKVQLGKDLSTDQVADIVAFLESLTGRIPEDFLKKPSLP